VFYVSRSINLEVKSSNVPEIETKFNGLKTGMSEIKRKTLIFRRTFSWLDGHERRAAYIIRGVDF
jgi:hypothetical protein